MSIFSEPCVLTTEVYIIFCGRGCLQIKSLLLSVTCASYRQKFIAQHLLSHYIISYFIILLPPANEVCEGYVFTGVCLSMGGGPMCGCSQGGHAWLLRGGMRGGACVVAPGGVCVVAPRGGMHGCSRGACMVARGGGACVVFSMRYGQ